MHVVSARCLISDAFFFAPQVPDYGKGSALLRKPIHNTNQFMHDAWLAACSAGIGANQEEQCHYAIDRFLSRTLKQGKKHFVCANKLVGRSVPKVVDRKWEVSNTDHEVE